MSKIVTISGGQAVTTSIAVAEGTKHGHEGVIKLVRKYQSDFQEFGLVRFEIQAREAGKHGGGDVEYAVLNEQQATLLLTYMRNSEIVRTFKKQLVKEFWEMVQKLHTNSADKARSRHIAASAYKLMSTVLRDMREAVGKRVAPHHFMNEAKLVNHVITGEFKGLDRDRLSLAQLDLLGELEVKNAALMVQGLTYDERKKSLAAFATAWRSAHPSDPLLGGV